jgi:hypothetical protein
MDEERALTPIARVGCMAMPNSLGNSRAFDIYTCNEGEQTTGDDQTITGRNAFVQRTPLHCTNAESDVLFNWGLRAFALQMAAPSVVGVKRARDEAADASVHKKVCVLLTSPTAGPVRWMQGGGLWLSASDKLGSVATNGSCTQYPPRPHRRQVPRPPPPPPPPPPRQLRLQPSRARHSPQNPLSLCGMLFFSSLSPFPLHVLTFAAAHSHSGKSCTAV